MDFPNFPIEIQEIIASHLCLHNTWRSVDEVVRDQASLYMAGREMHYVASILAKDLCKSLGFTEKQEVLEIKEPEVSELLTDLEYLLDRDAKDVPMTDIRAAAKRCGVKCKKKVDTLEEIRYVIRTRNAQREEEEASMSEFNSRRGYMLKNPLVKNPIPVQNRNRVIQPQKMSALGAKSRFALTDKDIEDVDYDLVRNPHYRSAAPMKLYLVADVREVALDKYPGGFHQVEQVLLKKQERSENRKKEKEASKAVRKNELTNALSRMGCQLRSDSRLCNAYIENGKGNLTEIVNTMVEMKFLFQHTRYRDIVDDIIDDYREWGEYYDYDDVSRQARSRAIREFKNNDRNLHLLPAHLR